MCGACNTKVRPRVIYIYVCEGLCQRGTGSSVYLHVFVLLRSPALRHRGAPRKHLVCVRQQRITKHDIVERAASAADGGGASGDGSVRLKTDAKLESERRERAAERAELEGFRKGAAEKAAREASGAAAKEAIDRWSKPALQQPRVQVQQAEQGYRNHTGMSLFVSQNGMRVPKLIDGQKLHLWSSRFQDFLTARGLIGTIEPESDPIRVAEGSGGMAERDRLIYRYGQEKVEKCEKAWEFLWKPCKGSLWRRGCTRPIL